MKYVPNTFVPVLEEHVVAVPFIDAEILIEAVGHGRCPGTPLDCSADIHGYATGRQGLIELL